MVLEMQLYLLQCAWWVFLTFLLVWNISNYPHTGKGILIEGASNCKINLWENQVLVNHKYVYIWSNMVYFNISIKSCRKLKISYGTV